MGLMVPRVFKILFFFLDLMLLILWLVKSELFHCKMKVAHL